MVNIFSRQSVLVFTLLVLLAGVGFCYSVGGTEYNYSRGIDGSNSSLILPLNLSTTGGSRGVPR